ncbi:MAG TPA: hypothetical protein VMU17_06355, partial [Elusimicrobiota bacterium]|nr:hypothetical protein [Elusimicrobiota bacterium]
SHLVAGDPAFRITLSNTIHRLVMGGFGLFNANTMAPALIYQQLIRQANMLAYIDVFRLMSGASILTLLLVFWMKRSPSPKGGMAVH